MVEPGRERDANDVGVRIEQHVRVSAGGERREPRAYRMPPFG